MIKKVTKDLKVAVLHGGISSERDVSLKSGQSVFKALKKTYPQIELIDVKHDFGEDRSHFQYDVYYNALHGEFGEDGQVQAILEREGKSFTSSAAESCRLAMDKVATKKLFLECDIPTASFLEFPQDHAYTPKEVVEQISLPLVLKPLNGGSSILMKMVHEWDDFDGLELTYPLFAEAYIDGREFTVSVLNGKALPVIEIVPKGDFYDFEAKYQSDDTQYQFDTVSLECEQVLRSLAEKVFALTHSRDAARVDFMIDKNDAIYVLEINSIPGMTSHSLLPKAAQKVGISFDELCQNILEYAINRIK